MPTRSRTTQRSGTGQPSRTGKTSAVAAAQSPGVFEFEHPEGSGRMYALPTRLKFGVLRKAARAGSDFDQVVAILEAVAEPDVLAVIDEMDVGEVEDLFARWQTAMGGRLGDT